MLFELQPMGLHWMGKSSEQKNDFCAHGTVYVKIGNETIDDGTKNVWCVSAGTLRLLRTLFENHLMGEGQFLLPRCGHFMIAKADGTGVEIHGSQSGNDWNVLHCKDEVELITGKGAAVIVPYYEYITTVLNFADLVDEFYRSSPPREWEESTLDFEKDAYTAFQKEWQTLRKRAGLVLSY